MNNDNNNLHNALPVEDERTKNRKIWNVIMASSLGTLIEWYDFFIFGSLAVVLSTKFFPSDNPTAAFLSTLATFAAGFVVRPFGALFFGRLGDMIGKNTPFLLLCSSWVFLPFSSDAFLLTKPSDLWRLF